MLSVCFVSSTHFNLVCITAYLQILSFYIGEKKKTKVIDNNLDPEWNQVTLYDQWCVRVSAHCITSHSANLVYTMLVYVLKVLHINKTVSAAMLGYIQPGKVILRMY